MKVRAAVAAALLVTGVATGTAHAETMTARTAALGYRCTFPGIPALNSTFTGTFAVDAPVPSGGAFTLTGVHLTHTMDPAVHSIFTAAGYDRVLGSFAATLTATNATPSSAPISGSFPEQAVGGGGSLTFPETAADLTFTAGTPGAAGFALGPQITETLRFHRKTTDTWVVLQSLCTLRVTSPAQNPAFQPDVPIDGVPT